MIIINILLIDQEYLFQQAFTKMLDENEDCNLVGIAENSTEALELMNRYHPRIVFSDAVLGTESGISLCNVIKERFPDTLTYILSNYCNFGMIRNSMSAGIEEYLYKPLSRKKLASLLTDHSKLKQEEEENVYYDALFAAIEERDYKKAYDASKPLVEWLFEECDKKERREKLYELESSLFYMVPGMDSVQKNYYLQKHDITAKVVNKSLLCYCFIVEIVTEVFRQLCTTKYIHMNQVFQYIEKNKNNEISLAELAAEAGISSGYLSRIFKKYYKISVVDYIHLRKLLMAKHYMATSEMNISDISFLLGYSEAGYFCKIFKKYEGQTPSAFHRSSQTLTARAV